MMAAFRVLVTHEVEVELDESKFDEAFMREFRAGFYSFYSLEDHAEHIAQLQAREVIDIAHTDEFIEGYGPSGEMGLKARVVVSEQEVLGSFSAHLTPAQTLRRSSSRSTAMRMNSERL
jgi:hypothetical protein